MSEIRHDPFTSRWIVVAAQRGLRPQDFQHSHHAATHAHDVALSLSTCPFEPGRESQTPPELSSTCDQNGHWLVRAIPNKFPAVHDATGTHEVIIESPAHQAELHSLPHAHCRAVLHMWRERIAAAATAGYMHAVLFKNHGRRAGASLAHPHSQLIASAHIAKSTQERLAGTTTHQAKHSRSLFAELVAETTRDEQRIVAQQSSFIAFCPFAARYAFEQWIVPQYDEAHFTNTSDERLDALAALLQECIGKQQTHLGAPAYNLILHTAPFKNDAPGFRWHIELIPITNELGGFERGTDCFINTVAPEEAAALLRGPT